MIKRFVHLFIKTLIDFDYLFSLTTWLKITNFLSFVYNF